MKTWHIVLGLAAVGAGAYYLSTRGTAAKAADAPTPPTTIKTSSSGVVDRAWGAVQDLIGKLTGSASSAPASSPTRATTTVTAAVRAADRPVALDQSNQPQLT